MSNPYHLPHHRKARHGGSCCSTMPPRPPGSPVGAALNFGVEKYTSTPVPVLAIICLHSRLEPLLSEQPARQGSAACCGYCGLLGTS
jgi:hypothetical protein